MSAATGGVRKAIVTGGSRGIGEEIARQLCGAGHDVVIVGRDEATLMGAADRTGAVPVVADVAEPGAGAQVVKEATERFGHVDLLVNNAGTGRAGPLLAQSVEDWWEVLRVNLYGPVGFMHAALPGMVERGNGLIVNIGSFGGIRPMPAVSAYATSKAALARLTDSVAMEVKESGVVVLCVSPGLVKTEMTSGVPFFESLPPEAWDPVERIAGLVLQLAGHPQIERLSGRFIHVRDDLERILDEIDRVEAEGLYLLGLTNLEGRVQ